MNKKFVKIVCHSNTKKTTLTMAQKNAKIESAYRSLSNQKKKQIDRIVKQADRLIQVGERFSISDVKAKYEFQITWGGGAEAFTNIVGINVKGRLGLIVEKAMDYVPLDYRFFVAGKFFKDRTVKSRTKEFQKKNRCYL